LRVDADQLRLKQIITNLLSNAIKYNVDDGWIRIGWTTGPAPIGDDGPAREVARIQVSDGGVGITENELLQLFQPYRRGTRTRQIKGVGLGLVIVKKLVEAHGGTLDVASEPGRGSTFTFTLPVVPDPEPPRSGGRGGARSRTRGTTAARRDGDGATDAVAVPEDVSDAAPAVALVS
jgi:signal transduction histidine kinase